MKSKNSITSLWAFIPLFFFESVCLAQPNQRPEIKNLTTSVNSYKSQIVLQFDLSDREERDLKITFTVSDDMGETYLVDVDNAIGDVGYPIKTGKSKKITWNFPKGMDLKHLKIKLMADDIYKIDPKEVISQIDTANIHRLVSMISGERNYRTANTFSQLTKVRELIEESYRSSGLNTYKQSFAYPAVVKDHVGENVIGRIAGLYQEHKTYLLTAHYDCAKGSPGADDNATGVAGMLEAMRVLSKYHYANSFKFIGFDLEEDDCLGSKAYVDKNGIKRYENILGVINYDMIGFYSEEKNSQFMPEGFEQLFPEAFDVVFKDEFRGNFVVNTANETSMDLGKKFSENSRKYVPKLELVSLVTEGSGEETPNLAASDHYEFWVNGFKAIHIGDGGESRNENLNGPGDVITPLNYEFMKKIVQATVATLADLADIRHATVVTVTL